MTILTQGRPAVAFILSEAAGNRSREAEFLGASQDIQPGQPLARVLNTTGIQVTAAAVAGNTGNGVLTLADPAYSKAAKPGAYKLTCIAVAANAGKFRVEDPKGVEIGVATVGVAFNKAIKFTLADVATDFAVGDSFEILVDLDDGGESVVAWDPTAIDGSEVAACLPLYRAKTGVGERTAIATLARDAEFKIPLIVWPATATTAEQKETAIQQMGLHGLIGR